MRFVPSLVHGVADYISGAAILVVPVIVQEPEPARHVMMIIATLVLLNAVLTNYELGILPLFLLRLHLHIEAVLGILMIVLPFIVTLSLSTAVMGCGFGVMFLVLAAATALPGEARGDHRRAGLRARR